MKKLLISSLKFFCLSAMKFFQLRLSSFTQFLSFSSVIISLELVFLNLRLTFGEDVLLLRSKVVLTCACSTFSLLTTCHNRSPRSFGHGRRRQTDKQAFSLGVIDMYSVVRYEASLGARCHRNPHPRGTVASRELWLGSGTL